MKTGGQIVRKAGKGWPAELHHNCRVCRKWRPIEKLDWYSPEMAACKGACSRSLSAELGHPPAGGAR